MTENSTSLTIAIPTYNRAALLDAQLDWLSRAIRGHEERVDILISDNASTDATPDVITKWAGELGPNLRLHRHERNLGAVRNIAFCIREARGRYAWTVSDDDPIDVSAVGAILERLDAHELGVLLLNFSSRDVASGRILFDRCFDIDEERVWTDGRQLFERLLEPPNPGRWGGLVLTTALVYRTSWAHEALDLWSGALENLNMQLFVTAYCATRGPALATVDNYLECASGTHHFVGDTRIHLTFAVAEYAESLVKLTELGIDPELVRHKIAALPANTSKRLMARGLVRHPLVSFAVWTRFVRALVGADRVVRGSKR